MFRSRGAWVVFKVIHPCRHSYHQEVADMAKYTKYDLGSHRGAQLGNPARPASAESSGSAVVEASERKRVERVEG